MEDIIIGNPVVPGSARGQVIVTDEPISFWGGYDHLTGEITDRRHPLSGQNASGKILAVPFTSGSSTTTAVLLEAVRNGKAPSAIITTGVDSFFALASIVARQMYQSSLPILAVTVVDFRQLQSKLFLSIKMNGEIHIQ